MSPQEAAVCHGARQVRASGPLEDGALARVLIREHRDRRMARSIAPGAGCDVHRTPLPGSPSPHQYDPMQTIMKLHSGGRPARGVRPLDPSGTPAYDGVRRTPVLPRGWAPLTADQQRAVLDACDASPDGLRFRLGSLRNPDVDYRVYRLHSEWAGLWLASRCYTDCDGIDANRDLLGLGADASQAVRIALDFFNSDLEARGESWRLGVQSPAVPLADPRRV
jgi:hypothetical protein